MPVVKVCFDDDSLALVRRAAVHETTSGYIRRVVLAELSKHRPRPTIEILTREDIRGEMLSLLVQHFPDRFPTPGNATRREKAGVGEVADDLERALENVRFNPA